MRLTTLGTGTIALAGDRVRAGHLVEAGGVRLLMDAGSGITHRLAGSDRDWWDITHVAVTHFHADHIGDLPTLIFAWRHARIPARQAPVTILGPVGTGALMDRLALAFGDWVTAPGFPLTIREIAPDERVDLTPDVRLQAHPVPHTPESVAYSVEHAGRRVVYTGDTGPDAGLATWAAGCDVLLAECSLPQRMAIPQHLTPESCGALAAAAQAKRLVLTHFYPPVLEEDIPGIVGRQYTGPVTLAHDGWHIELEVV